MGKRYFSDKIVKWYLDNKRQLPWRKTNDPYKIWLSEVILQQTRVNQGLPYYQQFVAAYPTVHDLANAPAQEVLRLWQGLGYYTRARNLHKCAKTIVELHHGKFPKSYHDLLSLPGIGHYTAAAIASFAFGEPVAVLDGNVFRILARIFGIDTTINSPQGKKEFSLLANQLISGKQPALHNQAVMEFGALFCTPHNPKCADCPFKSTCFAYNNDLVNALPVKTKRKKSRKRYFFYVVVQKNKSVLMKKRAEKDIWNGLYDFILIEKQKPVKAEKILMASEFTELFEKMETVTISKKYKHILTHQTIHCRFIHVKAHPLFPSGGKELRFYSPKEVAQLPKPSLISRFLNDQNPLWSQKDLQS
jgi:A/G-specific adenine glycosylase